MNKKISSTLLLYMLVMLSICSCKQRYWYRIKLDFWNKPELGTCRVVINNQAESMLSSNFNTYMKRVCERGMQKQRFSISAKDTTDFILYVSIGADTLIGSGIGQTTSASSEGISHYSANRKQIQNLIFRVELKEGKKGITQWNELGELYYLDDDYRDLGRSLDLVKTLIKNRYR